MQKRLSFWHNWSAIERWLCFGILGLLAVGSVGLLFFHYEGLQNVVRWDVLSELDETPVVLEQLQNQSLVGKAYFLKEQFLPSSMDIPLWLPVVYTLFFGVGLALILAAISGLKPFQYLLSAMTLVLILASFQFDILQSFSGKFIFLIWAIVLGGLSYYWNNFRPDIQMPVRIGASLAAVFGLLAITFLSAKASQPVFTFATFSVLGSTLLTVVFVGWLSVEIIAGFVYITTNDRTGFGKNSLYNFLFISVLYLTSVVLMYLKNTKRIDGDYWLLSPFVWLVVMLWLGVWSLEKRTEKHFPLRHIGFWLYGGLALVAVAAMSFALFSHNTPLIEVFEDAFVYSQLGIGLVFVIYVGFNFWPLFRQGKAVHKVLFRPMLFAERQAWIFGVIISVGIMALDAFLTVRQGWAGYQNAIGDLYTSTKEYALAEQYYKNALGQDFLNQKSNYALASLALKQNDRTTAGAYFRESLGKLPSPQAYVGLSHTLMQENLIFDAIFTLRKGVKTFPKSGEISNNLGYLYLKTNILDSAYYYFEMARQTAQRPEVPLTNLLAFAIRNPKIDIEKPSESTKYNSYQANLLAFELVKGQKILPRKTTIDLTPDSTLSINQLAWLYNATQSQADTTLGGLIYKVANNGSNSMNYDDLQMAQAYSRYANNKIGAFDLLAAQVYADTSQKTALAQQTLKFWYLKESVEDAKLNLPPTFSSEAQVQKILNEHPLNEAVLEKAVSFWNNKKQTETAYYAILKTLRLRENSPQVQKLYIQQCLRLNYTEFANDGLADLQKLISPADYEQFLAECKATKR